MKCSAKWTKWILDVTRWPDRCYCPIEDDGGIVVGFNLMQELPPGELVGIFHEDGQDAADKFWADHESEFTKIAACAESNGKGSKP